MVGTRAGGLKTARTLSEKYGKDFYSSIGSKGGRISRGGGFTGDPERARIAGRKGALARARNIKLRKEEK